MSVGIAQSPLLPERFDSQPFVCGHLGPDTRGHWPKLLAVSPTNVDVLNSTPQQRFAASASTGLETTSTGWCWGRYVARTARPLNDLDASQEMGLSGFWAKPEMTVLHVDGFGLQDIFVRSIGDTAYFANRLAPLVQMDTARLGINWDGWLTCIYLRMFSGSDTPFAEVTRLTAGERLVFSDGQVKRHSVFPEWLTSPTEEYSWDDLAEVLTEAVPPRRSEGADLTLSGGMDSRLLLAAMLAHGRRESIKTWSTFHEDGSNADMLIAKRIARAEGLLWTGIDYSEPTWLSGHFAAVDRLEYMTAYHGWFMPLSAALHRNPGPLLDGLGGDVLLRYHDHVPDGRQGHRAERIWSQLGGGRSTKQGVFHADVIRHWAEKSFDSWRRDTARWDEHPYGESLIRLFTRTAAGIAMAPFRVFGPERLVLTPFVDPMVVRVALSTPPLPSFRRRDLRPRLLAKLSPQFDDSAELTAIEGLDSREEKGRTSPISVNSFVNRIASAPIASELFAERFLEDIYENDNIDGNVSFALRTGALLADWLTEWGDRLHLSSAPIHS